MRKQSIIKMPIKQMFPQEEWLAFGIMDKK